MKIPNKIAIYIIEAMIGISILGIVIFFVQGIQKDSQKLVSVKKDFILLEQQIKDLDNLQKEYGVYQKNLEKINNFFVDSTFPVEFIQFLSNSASTAGVSMKISSTKEITEPESALSYNATLSGSFANLLRFVDKLENSPYLIEINNLKVSKITQGPIGNINASLELIVLAK